MNTLLPGLPAALLGLVLVGSADAQYHRPLPPPVRVAPARVAAVPGRAYYLDNGIRYNRGYYYPGQDHRHWSYRVWNARYNRYHYYDPGLKCYFYYNTSRSAYYPIDPVSPPCP